MAAGASWFDQFAAMGNGRLCLTLVLNRFIEKHDLRDAGDREAFRVMCLTLRHTKGVEN